jgi:hypothetical protein
MCRSTTDDEFVGSKPKPCGQFSAHPVEFGLGTQTPYDPMSKSNEYVCGSAPITMEMLYLWWARLLIISTSKSVCAALNECSNDAVRYLMARCIVVGVSFLANLDEENAGSG